MKLRFALIAPFLILACTLAAFSQPNPAGSTKVAVINSYAFADEKAGITKLVNAYRSLESEFKSKQDELLALKTRIENLAQEIQKLQAKANAGGAGVDLNAIQGAISAKTDEGERLQLDFKRKQEDAKSQYEKKEKIDTGPILKEIGDALEVYRKRNGIDLFLDVSKFSDAIIGLNESIDVTLAFIKEFNARSSGVPVKP